MSERDYEWPEESLDLLREMEEGRACDYCGTAMEEGELRCPSCGQRQ